jgi:hypothetical protein
LCFYSFFISYKACGEEHEIRLKTVLFAGNIPGEATKGMRDSVQDDLVGFYEKRRHGFDLFVAVGAWRGPPVDSGNLSGFNLVTLE